MPFDTHAILYVLQKWHIADGSCVSTANGVPGNNGAQKFAQDKYGSVAWASGRVVYCRISKNQALEEIAEAKEGGETKQRETEAGRNNRVALKLQEKGKQASLFSCLCVYE